MASALPEEGFCCPVCQDIFKNPVMLSCSHSCCKHCLKTWWREKPERECPICKRKSSREEPPPNLALRNLCDSMMEQRERGPKSPQSHWSPLRNLCSLHSEKVCLFCVDHQQPVCVVCRDSETHSGHRFRPIDDAAQQHKQQLKETLQPLKDKLKVNEGVQIKMEHMAQYIQFQVHFTETQIRETFQKLHQFLKEEEEARITALREEEEQKSQMIKEKIKALSRETAALSLTIRETVEQLKAEDLSFLISYKAAAEKVEHCLRVDDPQLHSGALLDQAKHLGNLSFNIWEKMKDLVSYSPVILDPKTASPLLFLTKRLTGVTHGDKQKVPANPERFGPFSAVLASEGFDSGTHSWEVYVGNSKYWRLGMVAQSVQRKEWAPSRLWCIFFSEGRCRAEAPPTFSRVLPVEAKFKKIRVSLNWSEGKLSFWDAVTDTEIHTFTHRFTEKMFPFISNGDKYTLEIVPLKLSVKRDLSCDTGLESSRTLLRP